jgi:hypothetical protein
MRPTVKPHRRSGVFPALLLILFLNNGCTSPPSVAPLLRVAERALLDESGRLKDDVGRYTTYTRQSLRSLEDAYNQDLDQSESLTPDWVREATSVYIMAREAVVSHQHALAQEHHARAGNLRAAASATRRAIALIEQQDKLLHGPLNEDLRRLLTASGRTREESFR